MTTNYQLLKKSKRFLIRHVGNMGDMIFLVPPVLATLKRRYPDCHITFVTAWGFKDKHGHWGKRNQSGFSLHLIMTNSHINQLIHWHDTRCSLAAAICEEDGQSFVTWSKDYYDSQKRSGSYDGVYELDVGLAYDENPLHRMYEIVGLSDETYSKYEIDLTASDVQIAQQIMRDFPHPRIVLLEGIEGMTTRGWDPAKIPGLEAAIAKQYGVAPIWFGSKHIREFEGRALTLRENIATLTYADVGIGVMSGPTHFAAAVGLPTLTLFCDQPLHRTAPAYFLNQYINTPAKRHRTLLGPTGSNYHFLKNSEASSNLTPSEAREQQGNSWQYPGRQSKKSCLAVITVDEVMTVLRDML